MNGKRAKALRKVATDRKHYRELKHSFMAYVSSSAQQPKPLSVRTHKPNDPIKPTWPASANQKRQSRPVIVINPVKQLCAGLNEKRKREIRAACSGITKRELDAAAVRGYIF